MDESPPANAVDMGSIPGIFQENPTYRRATKPMHHNYLAHALETVSCNYRAHVPEVCALQQEKPPQWEAWAPQLKSSPHSLQWEKAHTQQQRPSATKN